MNSVEDPAMSYAVDREREILALRERNRALLAALHGMLEDEGLHSVGCKEFPPGHDDSRCCPVHIALAAATHAPAPPSP